MKWHQSKSKVIAEERGLRKMVATFVAEKVYRVKAKAYLQESRVRDLDIELRS